MEQITKHVEGQFNSISLKVFCQLKKDYFVFKFGSQREWIQKTII